MRIPLAENLGNRVAEPVVGPRPNQGDGGLSQAVGRLGSVVQNAADQVQADQRRAQDIADHEEKQRQQIAQRAQAALTLAEVTNQAHDAHDEVARGVSDGSIPTDKAETEFTTRVNKLRDDRFSVLSEEQRGAISDNLTSVQGALGRNLKGVVIKRQQSETGAAIDQFAEQKQRDAMRIGPTKAAEDFDAMVDFTGAGAGWAPEVMAKKKQAFREGATYSFFDAAGTEALTRGDAVAVGKVLEQVKGPAGEAMDPNKRTALTHQLFGYQQHILGQKAADDNKLAQDAERREKAASDYYDQMSDIIMKGGTPSPDMIRLATGAAVGTGMQSSIGDLLAHQKEVAGFSTMTADQRAATISTFQAARADPKRGASPGSEKYLGKMVALDAQLTAETKDNPWGAARTAGLSSLPPLDTSNLDNMLGGIKQRLAAQPTIETWAGRKISPLEPKEAAAFSDFVTRLPSAQRSQVFATVGTMLDLGRLEALADQVDKHDKPMALAMKLGSDNTTAGRNVSELVLDGAQAIKDKTIKRDDAVMTGWRSEIAGMIRGRLGDPKMESDAIDSAYFVRAAMEDKGTNAPGFHLSASNEEAVKLVLGQPIERGGVKTVLPRGYTESTFDDRLKTFTPQILRGMSDNFYVRGKPVTPEQLSRTLDTLGMRRDGRGNYVPSSNGAFVTLDPGGQVPFRLPIR